MHRRGIFVYVPIRMLHSNVIKLLLIFIKYESKLSSKIGLKIISNEGKIIKMNHCKTKNDVGNFLKLSVLQIKKFAAHKSS